MSFEVIQCEDKKESCPKLPKRSRKLHRCLEMCINLKDRKILVAAHGVFVFSLGVVLIVGHYAINATTTSTAHTESSIPTAVNSVLVSQYILSYHVKSSLEIWQSRIFTQGT
jgi:hypothetical protein